MLSGPLHGGANEGRTAPVKNDSIPQVCGGFVRDARRMARRFPALATRVYKSYDPRAAIAGSIWKRSPTRGYAEAAV